MRGSLSTQHRRVAAGLLGLLASSFAMETFAAMEDIVVTTRKREENLQTVPIAIEALGGEEILRKGITDLQKLTQQSSSLKLDQGFSPQDLRINIRGLSPTRGRQNVAVLQDGIDISSESIGTAGGSLLINPRLFDLERVEIVKGPQMALYGRSAFAGAINYITRKPGDEFEADVRADVGNYGHQEICCPGVGPDHEQHQRRRYRAWPGATTATTRMRSPVARWAMPMAPAVAGTAGISSYRYLVHHGPGREPERLVRYYAVHGHAVQRRVRGATIGRDRRRGHRPGGWVPGDVVTRPACGAIHPMATPWSRR